MDVSKFIGSRFIKLADVEQHPIEGRIAGITEGKYGLNLILESGDTVNLNKTNTRALANAWGKNSDYWIDKMVRALAGELPYQGSTKRGVVVEPISSSTDSPTEECIEAEEEKPPFDDKIPF
jgi:hypothetical protein